jgi:hypothetical protein
VFEVVCFRQYVTGFETRRLLQSFEETGRVSFVHNSTPVSVGTYSCLNASQM